MKVTGENNWRYNERDPGNNDSLSKKKINKIIGEYKGKG
jgi:hypothetical protein